jgi:hypothetical protein
MTGTPGRSPGWVCRRTGRREEVSDGWDGSQSTIKTIEYQPRVLSYFFRNMDHSLLLLFGSSFVGLAPHIGHAPW